MISNAMAQDLVLTPVDPGINWFSMLLIFLILAGVAFVVWKMQHPTEAASFMTSVKSMFSKIKFSNPFKKT
jgi:hypothetical protein